MGEPQSVAAMTPSFKKRAKPKSAKKKQNKIII